MAQKEVPEIALERGSKDTGRDSSRGRTSKGVDPLPEGAVQWVFEALEQYPDYVEIAAHEENAEREMSSAEIEAFDLPEGTNLSVESLFGLEVGSEYIGNPAVRTEEFDEEPDPDELDVSSTQINGPTESRDTWQVKYKLDDELNDEESIDRHVTIEIGYAINGYHEDEVLERFGDNARVVVGLGDEDESETPQERAQYVKFRIVESDASEKRRARAKLNCSSVDYTQADFDEEFGED